MEIAESTAGAIGVVAPKGPLCGDDARAVRETVFAAIAKRRGRVVVDLGAVPFADSVGLEALLDVSDALAESGRSLKLVNVGATMREALDIVGIGALFEQYPDVHAAARSFL
ncbi:MAG: STAS domain-containing protein [Phycisphaerae bacterium]|jgi:anti-anti-sigma factor|nr:STAS domain-containing protein [Phycisphaerae bacterium]